ncbi:MAG: Ldh family oxidoreductase [Armatimonadota bacterium]|nr:Ldh family oxidoreductase [Armatimonadota bacterium]
MSGRETAHELRIDAARLRRFAAQVMARAGLRPDDAERVADCLVYADQRGLASHGVGRLPIYAKRLEMGIVNARPNMRFVREDGAAATLDADNGPGAVAATLGMQKAIGLAWRHGVGACAVRESNHCGAMAYYTEMATAVGMIGVAATSANPTVVPWGGRATRLGTNPISVAAPTPGDVPFVLDAATSAVARGKVILAAKDGTPIPEGWAVDAEGRPTTDPRAALEGALLPMAGPKGYGLALAVDVLCGVLAGGAFGRGIGALYNEFDRAQRSGHFFLALDVARFVAPETFAGGMARMIADLKATPPAAGFREVLLPGEPEAAAERQARETGVALPAAVVQELEDLSQRLGVSVPW